MKQLFRRTFIPYFLLAAWMLSGVSFTNRLHWAAIRAQSDPGPTVVTPHETIPNPVFGSALRVAEACKAVAEPCAWEAAATWTTGAPPDADSLVIVDGAVQINDANAVARSVGVYPGGQLYFNPAADTQLQSADVVVFAGGLLQIGTADQPIGEAQTAQIVLRDLPFANDPKQHLRGLVVVDGSLAIHGRALAEVYLRTAGEAMAGSDIVILAQSALAAGWRVGDEVLLPMSSQCAVATTEGVCPDESEARTIAAIAPDGLTVTLDQPLQFDHPGARDANGQLDFLPHLLNKSRNVIIRSENADGVLATFCCTVGRRWIYATPGCKIWGAPILTIWGLKIQKGATRCVTHHLIGPLRQWPAAINSPWWAT
ncbi:MAG: G8 domain-containing protein [Caldilineaceae bacterium]